MSAIGDQIAANESERLRLREQNKQLREALTGIVCYFCGGLMPRDARPLFDRAYDLLREKP